MNLSSFWKTHILVEFHLKGGSIVKVKCKNISYTHKNNVLQSYEMDGIHPSNSPLYIRIEDISAINIIK